jgi:hypothetical protein
MQHVDKNTNRTWILRIGQGGNPYSSIVAYGDAMPPQPQNHEQAPWVDEVWQMAAVDRPKNTEAKPYFVQPPAKLELTNGRKL